LPTFLNNVLFYLAFIFASMAAFFAFIWSFFCLSVVVALSDSSF
jgi:hypothetical protein